MNRQRLSCGYHKDWIEERLIPTGIIMGIACLSTPGCYQRLDLFISLASSNHAAQELRDGWILVP
jgi:hypothetical protein